MGTDVETRGGADTGPCPILISNSDKTDGAAE
jgi:hypothetical protein